MLTPSLEELRFGNLLRAIDFHFAKNMCRLAGENSSEVAAAAAMVSARLGDGHVCLDLAELAGQVVTLQDESVRRFPELGPWREQIAESPLVSDGSIMTPLVLDDDDRLYLRRYWLHENFLARAILERARPVACDAEPGSMQASLQRLFGDGNLLEDRQRMAALMAARRQFSVVSGGPGTGKTFTVVKILALLVEQAFSEGSDPPRMMLMAPTGKAAARLVESIKQAKEALDCEQEVKDAIPQEASTIHRALGASGSGTQFRYHEGNPLVTDLVLVDEASMVNLALMSRLLAAVPESARVILLGDRDQLASVEAGAVLADICNAGVTAQRSAQLASEIYERTGERLPVPEDAPKEAGIWDCVTHLDESYRYGAGSGIEALARAIHVGDADRALEVLRDSRFGDVNLAPAEPRSGMSAALIHQSIAGYDALLRASEPGEALAALGRYRILCAHHEGPTSVSHINMEMRQEVLRRFPQARTGARDGTNSAAEHYHRQPIIIGANDYELRLFNGDLGVVMDTEAGLRACFAGDTGDLRYITPSRLPPQQTVYAMSVHKSQGSEFDDIAVVLPREVSPVLSRELIYTAVTRAKHSLTIYASEASLVSCIARRTQRSSGLRSLLWGPSDVAAAVVEVMQDAVPEAAALASTQMPEPEAVPDPDPVPEPEPESVPVPVPVPVPESVPEPEPEPAAASPAAAPRPESRRRSKPAGKAEPARQLAFNLDGLQSAPKPAKPKRQRQALRRAALPSQTAACCGHKSAALLRCPRCAHVWVECCTC